MSFAEDEHAVGHLAAGGRDEPFRRRVRPRALRGDLAHGHAGIGQYGVEGGGELAGSVTDEDLELVARSPRSIRRLRAAWLVHGRWGWW